MAKNDYSRRSKKDVFWGDETTTTPYDTLSENSETANDDTEDDFDVEKFIRENDSKITTTVTAKIVTQILVVVLLLCITFLIRQLLCFSIFFYIIAFLIISNKFTNDYAEHINHAIKSLKKIKHYKHKTEGGAAWGKMISCPGKQHTKGLTRIEIGDNIINAMDLKLYQNIGRYDTITYFTGEYYDVSFGDKSFANNVMLVNGNIEHVKKRGYTFQHEGYTIYAYNEDYIENSDMNRVYALAQKLRNYLNNKNFIINFTGDKILLMLAADIKDNFHYGFFNYDIADRLRRDLTLLKNRIKIAKILASA